MDLHIFWFALLGILLTGYAVLDGFDLGVGIVHLFAKGDAERRVLLNSIGPLWDGNEVWLVTFGGALFSAFPRAYAAVMSGLYLPVMVLLASLIGRAISIEFRSKRPEVFWRAYWDASFFFSSAMTVFIMGVVVGNAMRGLPVQTSGDVSVSLMDVFHPYPLAVGVLALATCGMHGSIYLQLKTEGTLLQRVRAWSWTSFGLFLVAYLGVTIATLVSIPHATNNFRRWPISWIVVALEILAIANIPRAFVQKRASYAFASSIATIVGLVSLLGMALFPNLVRSSASDGSSLTIYNAASSEKTLGLMQLVAFLGMPFVIGYTAIVYWVFRGRTKLDKFSY